MLALSVLTTLRWHTVAQVQNTMLALPILTTLRWHTVAQVQNTMLALPILIRTSDVSQRRLTHTHGGLTFTDTHGGDPGLTRGI
jgi:hypothetical protein